MKSVKIKWIKERATESSSFSGERGFHRARSSPRSERSLNNYIRVPLSRSRCVAKALNYELNSDRNLIPGTQFNCSKFNFLMAFPNRNRVQVPRYLLPRPQLGSAMIRSLSRKSITRGSYYSTIVSRGERNLSSDRDVIAR